jgi:hypothetical protein
LIQDIISSNESIEQQIFEIIKMRGFTLEFRERGKRLIAKEESDLLDRFLKEANIGKITKFGVNDTIDINPDIDLFNLASIFRVIGGSEAFCPP